MIRYRIPPVSLFFCSFLAFAAGNLPFVDKTYLDAQFLNVEAEIKAAVAGGFSQDVAEIIEVGPGQPSDSTFAVWGQKKCKKLL